MGDVRIIVMCKAPMPGEVKTRLIPGVGVGSAANIHARLATETLGDCIELAKTHKNVQLELWCSPDPSHAFFQSFVGVAGMQLFTQHGEDLGERMANALCAEAVPSILIGTDCPPVNKRYLSQAVEALTQHALLIAPAEDGGYGLIGMQHPNAHVFHDIRWSTNEVLEVSLKRAQEVGLECFLLPMVWDVDEPADLDRWLAADPNKAN